jgi:hypothetical protein
VQGADSREVGFRCFLLLMIRHLANLNHWRLAATGPSWATFATLNIRGNISAEYLKQLSQTDEVNFPFYSHKIFLPGQISFTTGQEKNDVI